MHELPPFHTFNDELAGNELVDLLRRAVAALERLAPAPMTPLDLTKADAFVWRGSGHFTPVPQVRVVELGLLKGVDQQRQMLLNNTRRFAQGKPANNALLWGARGMGKSSLVKSSHARVNDEATACGNLVQLKLVEIHREDIESLPILLHLVRQSEHRFIVFCDDLSFDEGESTYKSLKAVLDGGVEGQPENVIFYATSNRRHLLARDMIENERATAINPGEATEEKVSLSDRFGLWLGFYKCNQNEFLSMVESYAAHLSLPIAREELHKEALEWSATRGNRSGRVAWQFIQDLAGRLSN